MSHDTGLAYTTDDDGIWLWCGTCREYVHNLGFFGSPQDAIRAELTHKIKMGANRDD